MSINISAANNQVSQLKGYADKLQQAKSQLNTYKSSLAANWQGREVPYMTRGIDRAIAQIDAAMRELREIAKDVSLAAASIKREEDAAAAAARARAAKEQRIAAAQTAYNTACDDLAKLNMRRDEIMKALKKRPELIRKYKDELGDLIKSIEAAEKKCNSCKNALTAARR